MKINKFLTLCLTVMFVSVLSGCNEEVVPTIEETQKVEEDYKSVLTYIEKKGIKLDEEVKRDKEGAILETEDSEKKPWELKDYLSVVHVIQGVKFGVNSINVESVLFEDVYRKYIVIDGDLYNSNEKEVAYGIIGDSVLYVDDRAFKLHEDSKNELNEAKVNFFDSRDTSLKFASNSSTNIKLYFLVNMNPKDLDLLKTIRLTNLNLDLLIRPQVYEEDRTEEDLKYLESQRAILLQGLDTQ